MLTGVPSLVPVIFSPHLCVGKHLAKLEMKVLLEALIKNVDRIEVVDPVPSSNGGVYGFESLQMRLIRD